MLEKLLELLENNSLDKLDRLSLFGYLGQLNLSLLSPKAFERGAQIVFHLLDEFCCSDLFDQLRKLHKCGYFGIENCIIRIHDPWLFEVLVLASLKQSRGLFKQKDREWDVQRVRELVLYIISKVSVQRPESLYMLTFLDTILKKRKDIVDFHSSLEVMKFAHLLAVSPIGHFKQYSQTFSKIVLRNHHFAIDLGILPIRSIETADIVPHINLRGDTLKTIADKVIKMFSYNVESRDGSFLYQLVIVDDFDEWKSSVWPLFYPILKRLHFEGELYESLVKYFIPMNTAAYKSNFFKFISTQELSKHLKAVVLLETRRKGFYIEEFDKYLLRITDMNVSLRIVSTYHKKTMLPRQQEMQLVRNYLELSPFPSLDVKSLSKFFSQIFLVAHQLMMENNNLELIDRYKTFLDDVFTLCVSVLNTSVCDTGAQLLMIIWEIAVGSSDALRLGYKLEEKFFYSAGENRLFKCIDRWTLYCQKVRLSVDSSMEKQLNCHLERLIANSCYGIRLDAYNVDFLLNFIKNVERTSIESVDTVRSYAHIVSRNDSCNNMEITNSLTQKIRENLTKRRDERLTFENVLLFEALSEVSEYDPSNGLDLCQIVEDSLVQICENLERPDDFLVTRKTQKVKEAFINVVLQLTLRNNYVLELCDKEKIFGCVCAIIETSNMKRPTVLSAELLQALSRSMDRSETDKNLKIKFLDRVLRNTTRACSTQTLSIRKNPETRLPVHALCLSDRHPQKPLLSWTLNRLLDIMSDPNSPHSSVASAVYCAEALISDNTLYRSTLPHIPEFIMHCVRLFQKPSWIVRNADLQLTKALIDRFYGVVKGRDLRPKTIEHLLLLFPQLAAPFCRVLSGSCLTDSCLVAMQFIAESHIQKPLYENAFFQLVRDFLLRSLATIIQTNAHRYGLMAVKAYAALCRADDAPAAFCRTVNYLIENLPRITLRNFLYLLRELYRKSRGTKRMHSHYRKLAVVAQGRLDPRYFTFLSFKICTLVEIESSLDKIDSSKYESRIWQNNYLPYLLANADDETLGYVLQKILRSDVSDCVQVKLLSVLVGKYGEIDRGGPVWSHAATVLITKVVDIADDGKEYLLLCYLKVILLLKGHVNEISDQLLNVMRRSYESVAHYYKIIVYVVGLASGRGVTTSDKRFIKLSIDRLKNLDFDDEEVSEIVSEVLPSLYKCTWCSCQRLEVHKMALVLLLKHGLMDFIEFTSGWKQRSPVEAAATFLDYNGLLKGFGAEFEVRRFAEFAWNYTSRSGSGRSQENNSYFTGRDVVHVDRKLVHKMIFKLCKSWFD